LNNHLRALVNPKCNFKSKRKLIVQKGVFIVPHLGSVLSGVIGSLINNNQMSLHRMILVPQEQWENRSHEPPPPVKEILKCKDHSYKKWAQVRLLQDPYLYTEKQTVTHSHSHY